jgi:hypothetical protein
MIDLELLKKHGLTDENLEKWLTGDPATWTAPPQTGGAVYPPEPAVNDDQQRRHNLMLRIRSRIQEGMNRNFADFQIYHALDLAWDAPLRTVSPTLARSLMEGNPSSEEVYRAATSWGLTSLVTDTPDPKDPTKTVKKFNFPMFFQVVVPLVRAYVTIRRGKIMNDRRLTPFWSYDPQNPTAELTIKCKALTDRVQIIATQYGYWNTVDQAVFMMLHYGQCFLFPKEEWHTEAELKIADKTDVQLRRTKYGTQDPADQGDEIESLTREGIRYHPPHPTRTYRDLAHGPATFNHDCGCEFAGYWLITRYKDVYNNNRYWNRDRIALGTMDVMASNLLFFNTVYSACTMSIPTLAPPGKTDPATPTSGALAAEVGFGAGDTDREKQIATVYYGSQHGDQGVMVTEHFEKLVPKDNGLGTYPHPVWFRFVVAGDGCTVLYAAPLPYSPVIYYGYDPDQNRKINSSLSLEILPFQDQFSMMLSQVVLTAKQNLANITFVDTDQIDPGTFDKIQNMGEEYYRFLNLFGYSSRKAARGLNRVADAVTSANLPKGDTASLINVLREILNVLERVLVMSSQEIAQAASHELRVDEVRNIQESTSSRLQFTATPVDLARDAHKRQVYQGLMAYGDPEFWVHIPSEIPLTPEVLTAMGFTFDDHERATAALNPKTGPRLDRFVKARISKKNLAMNLWEFSSVRDGNDRTDKAKIGAVLAQILQAALANPMLAQAIGPEQGLALTQRVLDFLGMPMDVKLRNVAGNGDQQQQQQAQMEQLKQVMDGVMKQVDQKLAAGVKPVLDELGQQAQELSFLFGRLGLPMPGDLQNGKQSNPSSNGNGNAGAPTSVDPRMVAPAGV